jgi:hypothetical protein
MMCDSKNSKLFLGDLIDEAVGKPAERISPPCATKYGTEQRIRQDEIGRTLELRDK